MGWTMSRLILLILAPCLAFAAGANGAILVDRSEVDLGFVYRDQPQRMTFNLDNTSGDSLHVVSIEPSCDCTTAQVVPEVIPPRGKGEVVVFFDPMGYEGRGKVKESVRLFTTDKKNPEILLTFAIEVGIGPEPEPRSLAFGQVAKGEADTLNLLIRPGKAVGAAGANPVRVLGVRSDNERVAVKEIGRTGDGADRFEVVVTNKAGGGHLSGFVTLETSDNLKREIRIPVTASLLGSIAAQPDAIAFGPTLPGDYIAQTVRVFATGNLKFKIESVTSSIGQLAFEVSPSAQGGYEIKTKIKQGAPSGRVMGNIRIETDRPDEPPLDIRVTGHVRSVR